MANPAKATLEAVSAAYEDLEAKGIKPTADRILHITGGSKNTVLAILEKLASSREPPPRPIPEQIEHTLRTAVYSVWTHANQLADKDTAAIRSSCQAEVAAAHERYESAGKLIRQLQNIQEKHEQTLEGYRREIAEQKYAIEQVGSLRAQVNALQADIKIESAAARSYETTAAELRGQLMAMTAPTQSKNRVTRRPHGNS